MLDLGLSLLKVMILATLPWVYFLSRYEKISSLLSSSKSISISGMVILIGFKNLSNDKEKIIGSISVISHRNEMRLPTAEPLPYPTLIPLSLANLT